MHPPNSTEPGSQWASTSSHRPLFGLGLETSVLLFERLVVIPVSDPLLP